MTFTMTVPANQWIGIQLNNSTMGAGTPVVFFSSATTGNQVTDCTQAGLGLPANVNPDQSKYQPLTGTAQPDNSVKIITNTPIGGDSDYFQCGQPYSLYWASNNSTTNISEAHNHHHFAIFNFTLSDSCEMVGATALAVSAMMGAVGAFVSLVDQIFQNYLKQKSNISYFLLFYSNAN